MSTTPTLLVIRGLPASGKTTYARSWVAEDRAHRARVNRDDFRSMVDDSVFVPDVTEPRIVAARDAAILALLKRGVSVVSDDTNLPQRTVRDLARLARRAGAVIEVVDLTHVPLVTCINRDAERAGAAHVGGPVIREMWERYIKGRAAPLPVPDLTTPEAGEVARYTPVPGTPDAVLLDTDGTAALMNGRSPYDYSRVGEDLPNVPVLRTVAAMHSAGCRVIVVSGRPVSWYDKAHGRMVDVFGITSAWYDVYAAFPLEALLMRPADDNRHDVEVKLDLFDAHVRPYYNVVLALEDRRQVVELWRHDLGIATLQVNDGDF